MRHRRNHQGRAQIEVRPGQITQGHTIGAWQMDRQLRSLIENHLVIGRVPARKPFDQGLQPGGIGMQAIALEIT